MTPKPNVIVVLADDMGYGDVGCYDPEFCKVPTPNIDRLAAEGMMFTDMHAASALCSPSRYALLTGRYAWRSPLQSGVLGPYDPPAISADRLTLPKMLKQQGYHTACVGKWHLGWDWPRRGDDVRFDKPVLGGPTTRGFDTYFGTDVPNYPPYAFIEGDRVQGEPTAHFDRDDELVLHYPGPGLPGWRFDRILPTLTERAVSYIDDRAAAGGPFLLYLPLTIPHEPIAPSERFKGKSGINGVADLLMETDWALGEVMRALENCGIADDTLLVFTTDNGHATNTGIEGLQQAGHRVSGPFRGYKSHIWEGGHRVPFVARCPGAIEAGTRSGRTACLTDLMATVAELVGAPLPDDQAEDSFSFLGLLRGNDTPVRDATVYHSGRGNFAVFQGPWKLALCPGSGGFWKPDDPPKDALPGVQLYNLSEDPAETRNLSARHPDVVRRLIAWLEEVVSAGRSRPGPPARNDVPVDIWKRPDGSDGLADPRRGG